MLLVPQCGVDFFFNFCLGCMFLRGNREQIKHCPQNCYVEHTVPSKHLLLGNFVSWEGKKPQQSRKCGAILIPCNFNGAFRIGLKRRYVLLSCIYGI